MRARTDLRPIYRRLVISILFVVVMIAGAFLGDPGPPVVEEIGWRGVLAIGVMVLICSIPFRVGNIWKL